MKSQARKPVERQGTGTLADLVVIDCLEVGPVEVEKQRVTTTYTVERDGVRDSNKLIYRFEEDVFGDDLDSHNLAAMMTAQVALNYGLFCKRIVFRGPFDRHDRRFLQTFAENTAREIYVNKFLMPNPFLVGKAAEMEAEPRERYLHASLEFDEDEPKIGGSWPANPERHAVLSSGGKDSLLSFGILRELDLNPHAIFVNESGRHWYTALNGYRHLKQEHPETARVWTNSDRLFSWMLRHLPFVRKDFANVRSDEYPIRLWTVAVFAFGALPLMRKRGLGRLLIGDEHDTTAKVVHKGIPHYNALYDQSRLFDQELTRFYRRKGWGAWQFSILRPLSELLVEKTLAERYPDLLRHQVSCHATHIEEDRVLPCGACEKCRRIVGMLLAIGADPETCGYTRPQIERALRDLADKGVHQESEGAEQLAHMLVERGLLPAKSAAMPPQARPEAMKLRFHSQRSPVEVLPQDLRERVYRLFLEHADGALIRRGRVWADFDPLSPEALSRPSLFERGVRSRVSKLNVPLPVADPSRFLLAEMTWTEAESHLKHVDLALLPVGAIEQHGPHLPLDTDAFDADYLARRVAAACTVPRPLVLPLVAYGVSYHHQEFAGTLSVSPETQAKLIYEIGMSAARCGITKLVMINGHGGNAPALHLAAQMINRDAHIFTCVDTGETSDADVHDLVGGHNDVHAGEIETSTTLAIRPDLVHMDRASNSVPQFSSGYLDFTSNRGVGWYAYTEKISRDGIMGDATRATAEKGEKIWAIMTERLVELVEDLKRLSLDEIYQRRY